VLVYLLMHELRHMGDEDWQRRRVEEDADLRREADADDDYRRREEDGW
jgi:hypothetical protein